MKRPIGIYFVAAWTFLAMVIYVTPISRRIASAFLESDQAVESGRILGGILGILVIWHTVRLINLRAFNRWLSIVYLALFTLMGISAIVNFFSIPGLPRTALFLWCAFCLLSVASLWYLVRDRFRDFAKRFVSERDKARRQRDMMKASQEAAKRGYRS